jgi:hypothetical protein
MRFSIAAPTRKEPKRDLRSSTKNNSDFKWKNDRSVVGALEIVTDPHPDLRAAMVLHAVAGYEGELEKYYRIWKKLKLRGKFIKAYESIPPQTTCCGLITKVDETIKENTPLLNNGWVKTTNENILEEEGFRISIFVWSWTNISGKSETVIPMIRFHRLSKN